LRIGIFACCGRPIWCPYGSPFARSDAYTGSHAEADPYHKGVRETAVSSGNRHANVVVCFASLSSLRSNGMRDAGGDAIEEKSFLDRVKDAFRPE
jgi:hypothetical protein